MRTAKLIDGVVWDAKNPAAYADEVRADEQRAKPRLDPVGGEQEGAVVRSERVHGVVDRGAVQVRLECCQVTHGWAFLGGR